MKLESSILAQKVEQQTDDMVTVEGGQAEQYQDLHQQPSHPLHYPPANPSARSPTTPVPRTGKEATALSHSANCQMLSVCAGACFTDAKSQTSLPLATGSYVLTGFLQGLSAAAQAPGP